MMFGRLFWQKTLPKLLLWLSFLPTTQAISATIISTGDWFCELPDNIAKAGHYYPDEIQSSPDALPDTLVCSETHLSIVNISLSSTAWTITSRLETSLSGLTLDLRRIGNGSGLLGTGLLSASSGGEDYIRQSTLETPLFTGQGLVDQIPLQFRIGGLGVDDGNGIKNIKIKYKIIEN